MSKTLVLIDADGIVYRVGFAAQQTVIHAIAETDKEAFRIRFEGKKDRNSWLAEHPGAEIVEEQEEIIAEPLPFALQTVKQVMGALEMLGSPKVYLTGKGNFREKLSTVVPYKVNRRHSPRPVHYQAIRDFLVERYGARIVNGREADDELSILANQARKDGRKHIVASIDKDLDQIPGRHYDYARHVSYRVTEEEAQKWFWRQCLSGDPTDSIPGCHKIGPKTAEQLVDTWFLEERGPVEIWSGIVEQYEQSQKKPGCAYANSNAIDIALETARLVYMQKEPGELWNPPGIPFGKVEGDTDD